ncbi:MAG: Mrp/NBP35 family ATP-binding protein [Nitrospirota bacterium]
MAEERDLKQVLSRIKYTDDAKVQEQIVDQLLQVKTRMGRIKRKILVMSGKGGVGKSMVTVNLALAFARVGHTVGLLDIDLNGPCVPAMLGLKGQRFTLTGDGALPPVGPLGIKVASMEFLLQPDAPVRWKGPMELSPVWLGLQEMSVIREFLADIAWGELDYLFTDLPPGAAADKPPVMAGYLPELDGAVIVTIPSEVATQVVKKSISYARDVGIKVLGLIENMSGTVCQRCGAEEPLFSGDAERIARDMDVPFLGRVPFDRALGGAADRGEPLLDPDQPSVRHFAQIAERLTQALEFKKMMASLL